MKMKGILAVLLCLLLLGCAGQGGDGSSVDTTAWLSMNTEFPFHLKVKLQRISVFI